MLNVGIGEFILGCGQAVKDLWEIICQVDHDILIKAGILFGAAFVAYRILSIATKRSFSSYGWVNAVRRMLNALVRLPVTIVDYVINKTITGFVKSGSWVKGLFAKKAVVEETPAEDVAESVAV